MFPYIKWRNVFSQQKVCHSLFTCVVVVLLGFSNLGSVIAASSCLETWSSSNSRNSILNSDFEDLNDYDSWVLGTHTAVTTSIDSSVAYNSSRSSRADFVSGSATANQQNYYRAVVTQKIPVTAGRTYRFSGYIKTDNLTCDLCAEPGIATWNGARLEVIDGDVGGSIVAGDSIYDTTDWTLLSKDFVVPTGMTNAKIRLRRFVGSQSGISTGTAWWDGVQFVAVPIITNMSEIAGEITITGEGFSNDPGNRSSTENCILFNGSCLAANDVSTWTDEEIKITVTGNSSVSVRSGGIVSNTMSLQSNIAFGNASLSIDFAGLTLGGGIAQITDIASGRAFVDPSVSEPLYELTVKDNPGTSQKTVISSEDASSVSYSLTNTGGEQVLTTVANHCGEFTVTTIVTLPAVGSARFSIDAQNSGTRVIQSARYPIVAATESLGSSPDDDAIIIPYFEGYLLRNPAAEPHDTRYKDQEYPGPMTLQMMGFYDDEPGAGLYMASDDNDGYKKRFGVDRVDNAKGIYNQFSFKHITSEISGNVLSPPYNVIIDTFDGDWHDAADQYKQWAELQPWTATKLSERTDIPPWLFDIDAMVACYHCPHEDYGALADKYKTMLGVSDLLLYPGGFWGFHSGTYIKEGVELDISWSGVDYFSENPVYNPIVEQANPPFTSLENGIDDIHSQGAEGLFFIEGPNWDQYSYKASTNFTGFDDCKVALTPQTSIPDSILYFDDRPDYEMYGEPHAVINENNAPRTSFTWGTSAANQDTHCRLTTTICIGSDANNAMDYVLYNNINRGIDHGAKLMSLDALVSGRVHGCWNAAHGHPLGEGHWTHTRLTTVFDDINNIVANRGKTGDFGFAMEDVHELYLPHLQFQYLRHSNLVKRGNKKIPLFNYIYKEYYLGAERGMNLGAGNTLGMRWALAMDFLQGNIQGTMTSSELSFTPDTFLLDYYHRLISMKRSDFYRGSMQRPPAMTGLLAEAMITQNSANGEFIIDPIITNSLKTDTNTISHLLVNTYLDGTNSTDIGMTLTANDLPSSRVNVTIIKNSAAIFTQDDFTLADALPTITLVGGDVVEVHMKHWDIDNDGVNNNIDTDDDNDFLLDNEEITLGTDPFNPDSDNDGVLDGIETEAGTDPSNGTSVPVLNNGDANNDNLVNLGDLVITQRIVMGQLVATPLQMARLDVAPLAAGIPAPDGQIAVNDYFILLRKVIGLISF